MTRRTPTGAAVLQPDVTKAITEAVLAELAERGYARLSMEAVAKRAGVGKSALYRRWPSKLDMTLAVVAEFSVGQAEISDTGSLAGDVRKSLEAMAHWLSHPQFSRILADLVAEMGRSPELSGFVEGMIGQPRRARGRILIERAIARGELDPDVDLEFALDLLPAPIYWRLLVRDGEIGPEYLDKLTDFITRGLGTETLPPRPKERPIDAVVYRHAPSEALAHPSPLGWWVRRPVGHGHRESFQQ